MEYCNSTLRKVIDEAIGKPIEETEKIRMIHQIVEALVYLYGQKLIHRDSVSPKDNVAPPSEVFPHMIGTETRERVPCLRGEHTAWC